MLTLKSHRSAVIIAAIILLAVRSAWSSDNDPNQSDLTMEFVRIPAGSFYMEHAHHVQFKKPFYMGKYEVTQAQWKAVMGTTVCQQHKKANSCWQLKGVGPEHPIYYVSWEEAAEFCKRLGSNFRLPSESEREYACRAGSETRLYYGDDPNYSQFDSYAWYYDNSKGSTHPVGEKMPNEWGLYDMYGNVSEWCSDRLVYIGSNWFYKPTRERSVDFTFDGGRSDLIGFRVVFTDNLDSNNKVLEIALPKGIAELNIAQEKKPEIKPVTRMAIPGVIRDDAGIPIDGVNMKIPPGWDWLFREYPEGKFEAYQYTNSSQTSKGKYYFLAQHLQRNLFAFMEFNEDVNNLDIRLEQGAILSGKVVDPYDKGIQNVRISTTLEASDWREHLSPVIVEPHMEGKFEIRALPLGHKYKLRAYATGYRINKIEVSSGDTPNNRIDIGSIVLDRGQFSVSGVVVDKKGKPVANAVVISSGKNQIVIKTQTDAKGKFTLDGIFKGQVKIYAEKEDSSRYVWYASRYSGAGVTNVKIVLKQKSTFRRY
jgi:hypothetical protein